MHWPLPSPYLKLSALSLPQIQTIYEQLHLNWSHGHFKARYQTLWPSPSDLLLFLIRLVINIHPVTTESVPEVIFDSFLSFTLAVSNSGWTGSKLGKEYNKAVQCYPAYFNLHAEYIMWNARLDETQAGIKTAKRNINNLRYVDTTPMAKMKRN